MRCSACQASLPEGAQWCGQCFAAVGAPAAVGNAVPFANASPAATYGGPPSYGQQPYAPPAPYTVPGPAPAPPAGKSRTALICAAVAGAIAIAAGVWQIVPKPGPTLRVGDVSMATPDGWSSTSTSNAQSFAHGMATSLGAVSDVQVRAAMHGDHRMAALALVDLPQTVSADVFLDAYRSLDGRQVGGVTMSNVTSTTVGSHQAVQLTVTSPRMNGTIVFIPEGTTLVMCVVGTDEPNVGTDKEFAWIVEHLTATT
ncbi:MAG: hypothetical protein JWM93_2322 [Frankiales bacterium]|nr:hypothetical protein [Frankiales bacterium]